MVHIKMSLALAGAVPSLQQLLEIVSGAFVVLDQGTKYPVALHSEELSHLLKKEKKCVPPPDYL